MASLASGGGSSALRHLLGRRTLLLSRASRSVHSSAVRFSSPSTSSDSQAAASTSASASASGWAAGTKASSASPEATKPSAASQLASVALAASRATGSSAAAATPVINLPGSSSVPTSAPIVASSPALTYAPNALPTTSDPLISAFINLLMRDGKKALATKQTLEMLRHLSSWLRTDPLPALAMAVERASPLVRMQTRKSGGKNVQVPLPLNERQSRRRGIVAILEASKKRGDRQIAVRMAKEVCAVLEGQSSTLNKKEDIHKTATANRSNASVRI